MLALPDEEDDFDKTEEERESTLTLGTPMLPTKSSNSHRSITPTPISHNININYRHCYTVEKKNGEEVDIPALLQSLAYHTTVQSASKGLQPAQATQNEPLSPSKPKIKSLFFTHSKKKITFTALDISDPPHLKYSDDLDALPVEWEKSSHLRIKGVPIALKYWSEVFRWARPEAWSVIKDSWSNWKVTSSSCFSNFSKCVLYFSVFSLFDSVHADELAVCCCLQFLPPSKRFLA